jgi:hypothetical protein
VHTTSCNFTGGTPAEACVRYVRVTVFPSSTSAWNYGFDQELVSGGGNRTFHFMPSVAVNNSGQTAISFQTSSATSFLSSSWGLKNLAATSFTASGYTTGTCALPPSLNSTSARTGDYSGAQMNPADLTSFWLAGERARFINGVCRWSTQIIKLVP